MRSTKWPSSNLNFYFSEIIVVFPLELRLAEQKVIGQGTNFTSGSLEVMPIDTASIYAP